jgi:hypothetical protein
MNVRIEFIKDKKELALPIIKLTKSLNGKTGTASFVFIKPNLFRKMDHNLFPSNMLQQVSTCKSYCKLFS